MMKGRLEPDGPFTFCDGRDGAYMHGEGCLCASMFKNMTISQAIAAGAFEYTDPDEFWPVEPEPEICDVCDD
jgi:hypothetical protein